MIHPADHASRIPSSRAGFLRRGVHAFKEGTQFLWDARGGAREAKAIRKALVLYQEPKLLSACRQNAMLANFSWDKTVLEYQQVYEKMLGK